MVSPASRVKASKAPVEPRRQEEPGMAAEGPREGVLPQIFAGVSFPNTQETSALPD